ncbi:putative Major facilitator superfamily (MFS) profile domain-containing protein [Seiridium cardinale]
MQHECPMFNTGKGAEQALVRRLDTQIVPMVMELYLEAFLDRVNIGIARLYEIEEDLNLVGDQYQISVSLLFVIYLLIPAQPREVPSNLAIKKLQPNLAGLVVCRLLLGALEAGLCPGLTLYLTFISTRKELALRIGYIFVSVAIAGAFGGLFAFGIGYMDGLSGQRGWRWIFIIEGLPSIVVGVAAGFFLANSPEEAHYLDENDK